MINRKSQLKEVYPARVKFMGFDDKSDAKPRFRLIAHPQLEAWICYMIDRHGKIIATKTKLIRML